MCSYITTQIFIREFYSGRVGICENYDSSLISDNNFNALSLCLGFMVTDQKIQPGFYTGFDVLGNQTNSKYDRRYQKQMYLSIGLGYSIFQVAAKSDKYKHEYGKGVNR